MTLFHFILPVQIGATTIDGTIFIILGVLAVLGILYKNRNNISFNTSELEINDEKNAINEFDIQKLENTQNIEDINNIQEKETNIEEDDELFVNHEKEKVLN